MFFFFLLIVPFHCILCISVGRKSMNFASPTPGETRSARQVWECFTHQLSVVCNINHLQNLLCGGWIRVLGIEKEKASFNKTEFATIQLFHWWTISKPVWNLIRKLKRLVFLAQYYHFATHFRIPYCRMLWGNRWFWSIFFSVKLNIDKGKVLTIGHIQMTFHRSDHHSSSLQNVYLGLFNRNFWHKNVSL